MVMIIPQSIQTAAVECMGLPEIRKAIAAHLDQGSGAAPGIRCRMRPISALEIGVICAEDLALRSSGCTPDDRPITSPRLL